MSGRRADVQPVDDEPSYQEQVTTWYYKQPYVSRGIMVSIIVVWVFTTFGAIGLEWFAFCPVANFTVSGLITPVFVSFLAAPGILAVLISSYFAISYGGWFEREFGSLLALFWTVTFNVVLAIAVLLVSFLLAFNPVAPMPMLGSSTCLIGYTNHFFIFLTMKTQWSTAPHTPFCGIAIPTKLYPLFILFIFAIIGRGTQIVPQLLGIGLGYLYANRHPAIQYARLSDGRVQQLEANERMRFATGATGFVPLSEANPNPGVERIDAAAASGGGGGGGSGGRNASGRGVSGARTINSPGMADSGDGRAGTPMTVFGGSGQTLGRAPPNYRAGLPLNDSTAEVQQPAASPARDGPVIPSAALGRFEAKQREAVQSAGTQSPSAAASSAAAPAAPSEPIVALPAPPKSNQELSQEPARPAADDNESSLI